MAIQTLFHISPHYTTQQSFDPSCMMEGLDEMQAAHPGCYPGLTWRWSRKVKLPSPRKGPYQNPTLNDTDRGPYQVLACTFWGPYPVPSVKLQLLLTVLISWSSCYSPWLLGPSQVSAPGLGPKSLRTRIHILSKQLSGALPEPLHSLCSLRMATSHPMIGPYQTPSSATKTDQLKKTKTKKRAYLPYKSCRTATRTSE